MPPKRDLDPARSLWHVIAIELERQMYIHSLQGVDLARILKIDPSTVSRILSGGLHLKPEQASLLDGRWKLRGLLTHLVAHACARPDPDDDEWLPALAAYEARATRHRIWDHSTVPGLLQTPDYARATFQRAYTAGLLRDVESALQTRMERQTAIWERDDPPRVSIVLSWTVLATPAGDFEIMKGQLTHLLNLGERPGVSVRIVDRSVGFHVGHDGSFRLLTVGGAEAAFSEAPGIGRLFLEAARVDRYALRFEQINDVALPVGASQAALEKARDEYA
ncbi:DUF5753 domain-containing protein [Spirillospora sp. CA-253888]